MTTSPAAYPAAGDLQALVRGHLKRPASRHLLFHFRSADGARRMLAGLPVTLADSAELDVLSAPLVSLGITVHGLRALGVADAVVSEFDPRFVDGFAPKRLGDHPETASHFENWWERQFLIEELHCVVHVHALDHAQLEERTRALVELAGACGARELRPRADGTRLDAAFALGERTLHFGYKDGISGPNVAWDEDPASPDQLDARHFVLGYSTPECESFPDSGAAADLARGSTYGVFRWIHQHVARFNQFLREQGPALFPDLAPADAEELLAAKLMGRWRDGTPLVLAPDRPDDRLSTSDAFGFQDEDAEGLRCPFAAHIRVMNPRDQALKKTSGYAPAVLRRGMPYGPALTGLDDDGVDRGLLGVFFCTDISRQILTLTKWAQQTDFSPVFRDSLRAQDALIGNRTSTDTSFRIPGAGTVPKLPSFLTTKGTALALYPGRHTLEALISG